MMMNADKVVNRNIKEANHNAKQASNIAILATAHLHRQIWHLHDHSYFYHIILAFFPESCFFRRTLSYIPIFPYVEPIA